MSFEPRPPVFASAEIRVQPVPGELGMRCARISVAGVTVTLSEHEARALCTALRDALEHTEQPALPGVAR